MAVCDITAGRDKFCKQGNAGVKYVYLINDIEDPFTVVDSVATGINAGITEVFKFELLKDGNSLEQSHVGDSATMTTVNTQTLTLLLGKLDVATDATLNLLVAGYPRAVVVDKNGNYKAVGIDDGIDFTIAASTGAAKSDFNGYTLTGTATTDKLAPTLDESTVTALLALVA